MEILAANESHVSEIGRLFDLYRQFYECEPDLALATRYIGERLANGESVIFVAAEAGSDRLVGFTQLYATFCSVQAVKIYVLYDLYVDAEARNKGVGALLMNRARAFAEEQGAKRIDLLTGKDNFPGQHLYEKLGYERANEEFFAYSLAL